MPITNPDYDSLSHDEVASLIGIKASYIPMLIESFLEEGRPTLDELENSIQTADYDKIRISAHSITGSAANLQLIEVASMAKEMELAAAKADDTFDYQHYFEAIKNAINTIKV